MRKIRRSKKNIIPKININAFGICSFCQRSYRYAALANIPKYVKKIINKEEQAIVQKKFINSVATWICKECVKLEENREYEQFFEEGYTETSNETKLHEITRKLSKRFRN